MSLQEVSELIRGVKPTRGPLGYVLPVVLPFPWEVAWTDESCYVINSESKEQLIYMVEENQWWIP